MRIVNTEQVGKYGPWISTNGYSGNDKTRALLKSGQVQYFAYNSKQKAPLPTTVAGITGATFIAIGANNDCATLVVASIEPRSSSSRKCFRSVFGSTPT